MVIAALYPRNQVINAEGLCRSTVTARLRIGELDLFIVVKRPHLQRACRKALVEPRTNHVVCASVRVKARFNRSVRATKVCV